MRTIQKFLMIGVGSLLLAGLAAAQDVKLVFTVENRGQFTMTLFPSKAPKTAAHILRLAESGFYNGQRFHRVLKSPRPFLVQIGDPASKEGALRDDVQYRGGSGAKIPYENSGLENNEGMVGLAAESDRKDSGDSQFYILLDNSRFLNGKFTVFAQITKGLDVVNRIERGDRVVSVKVTRD